jgi:hypothetical protein
MFENPKSEFLNPKKYRMFKTNMLLLCTINNLPCVIPSEAKESRLKIATPACHNKALRCAGTSLMLLAMTTYRSVKDGR